MAALQGLLGEFEVDLVDVVCNVYTYRLDARQIAPLVEDLENVEAQLRSELNTFADRIERIGAAGDLAERSHDRDRETHS